MDNTIAKLGQIRVFSKVLSKVSQIRNRGAKQKVLSALEKNEYFQRLIHNPAERQDFLTQAAPYMKYRFYPKGTSIIGFEQTLSSFPIIVKGKAFQYVPKTPEELKKECSNPNKTYMVSLYMKHIAKEQLEEKFKKWLRNNDLGTKALRKKMASLNEEGHERDSEGVDDQDNFSAVLEKILKEDNLAVLNDLQESDLSFDEKLLIVSTFGLEGRHLINGNLGLKKACELREGDTFGEATLIKSIQTNYTVVAAEDTHIVSFTRNDYRLLFLGENDSIKAKVDFVTKIFPEVSRQTLIEMCYFLEEKLVVHSETIYKEGDDVDGIYMLRNGEIEMFTTKEHQTQEQDPFDEHNPVKVKSKANNDKQKIIIGRLPTGSIFGEEEVLKRMDKRKFSAKTYQPNTRFYVIKRRTFCEVFEQYFPEVAKIMKDWMNLKYKWREERLKKEQMVAELKSEEKDAKIKRRNEERAATMIYTGAPENKKLHRIDTQRENIGDVPVNYKLKVNSVSSPTNGAMVSSSTHFYFNRVKRNMNEEPAQELSQTRTFSKTSHSKDLLFNHEGPQKTRLFMNNQSKLNKFKQPTLASKSSSKTIMSARGPAKKLSEPSPSYALNFDQIRGAQKTENACGLEPLVMNSGRKPSSLTHISPKFFVIKSYGLSTAVPTPTTTELSTRRNSTYFHTEDGNLPEVLPLSSRTATERVRTAGEMLRSKKKGLTHACTKTKSEFESTRCETTRGFVQSTTSLQSLDGKEKDPKGLIVSSLAHLDHKGEDAQLVEPLAFTRSPLALKEMNFLKKPLSLKMTGPLRPSPRVRMSVFRGLLNGVEI